jgi:large subunit ribosomal protein L19
LSILDFTEEVFIMDIIRALEQQQIKEDRSDFRVGDHVKVHYRIIEGNKERIQIFEGDIIRRHGASNRETFTVRKLSSGIGVERTFPVHSPKIDKVDVTRHGAVRRAKLYFLRDKVGKAARLREKGF